MNDLIRSSVSVSWRCQRRNRRKNIPYLPPAIKPASSSFKFPLNKKKSKLVPSAIKKSNKVKPVTCVKSTSPQLPSANSKPEGKCSSTAKIIGPTKKANASKVTPQVFKGAAPFKQASNKKVVKRKTDKKKVEVIKHSNSSKINTEDNFSTIKVKKEHEKVPFRECVMLRRGNGNKKAAQREFSCNRASTGPVHQLLPQHVVLALQQSRPQFVSMNDKVIASTKDIND